MSILEVSDEIKIEYKLEPTLHVEKVCGNETAREQIAEIATIWQKIASVKEDSTNDDDEKKSFKESHFVLSHLARAATDSDNNFDLWLCRDDANQPQALAVTAYEKVYTLNKDLTGVFLKIELLATHPKNIRCDSNKNENQVAGAGTKLIKHFAKIALIAQQGLCVCTTLHAKGFYQKLGFEYIYTKEEYGSDVSDRMYIPFEKL